MAAHIGGRVPLPSDVSRPFGSATAIRPNKQGRRHKRAWMIEATLPVAPTMLGFSIKIQRTERLVENYSPFLFMLIQMGRNQGQNRMSPFNSKSRLLDPT